VCEVRLNIETTDRLLKEIKKVIIDNRFDIEEGNRKVETWNEKSNKHNSSLIKSNYFITINFNFE